MRNGKLFQGALPQESVAGRGRHGLALGMGVSWGKGPGRGGGKRQRACGAGAGVWHAYLLGTYVLGQEFKPGLHLRFTWGLFFLSPYVQAPSQPIELNSRGGGT